MKNAFVVMIFAGMFLSGPALAQRWKKGYIVKLTYGDTVEGYIQKNWRGYIGPKEDNFLFMEAKNSQIYSCGANAVRAFGIGKHEIYRAQYIFKEEASTISLPDSSFLGVRDTSYLLPPEEFDGFGYEVKFKVAKVNLPARDSSVGKFVFSHVLFESDLFEVFEVAGLRRRYFIRYYSNSVELREVNIVTPTNRHWIVPQYKNCLLRIIRNNEKQGKYLNVSDTQREHLQDIFRDAAFDEEGIWDMVGEMNSLERGRVYYRHKHRPKEDLIVKVGTLALGIVILVGVISNIATAHFQ